MFKELLELEENEEGQDISLTIRGGEALLKVFDNDNVARYEFRPTEDGRNQAQVLINGLREWLKGEY